MTARVVTLTAEELDLLASTVGHMAEGAEGEINRLRAAGRRELADALSHRSDLFRSIAAKLSATAAPGASA